MELHAFIVSKLYGFNFIVGGYVISAVVIIFRPVITNIYPSGTHISKHTKNGIFYHTKRGVIKINCPV